MEDAGSGEGGSGSDGRGPVEGLAAGAGLVYGEQASAVGGGRPGRRVSSGTGRRSVRAGRRGCPSPTSWFMVVTEREASLTWMTP